MLNTLLGLPKDKRKVLLSKIKFETKLHIFNQIYTMTEELGLDDVTDYETRVKMRAELIERFPDQVFWDFAEHTTPNSGVVVGEIPDFEQFRFCKVSTRGDIVLFNEKKRLYIHTVEPKDRYRCVRLNWKQKTHHRLVASTFIPRPNRLKDIPYRQLQVNHIDGTRWQNGVSNLEWVSDKENQRHRYLVDGYGEEKYFLFKVIVDNGFKDREFVLSEDGLSIFNLNFTSIRKVIAGYSSFKGFIVSQINHEDINDRPLGFPSDIEELFSRDIRYFNARINPIIGTVLRGKFEGIEFSLFGAAENSNYFNRASIELVAKGRLRSHHGCSFRYATHKEAIPLHGKLTEEIAADANPSKTWRAPKIT